MTPETFHFLGELARNNDRDWFNANKQRYIEEVRDPLCSFIEAFAPRLAKIHANLVADSRPNGGSLLRIYRDTRFSKDKRPYHSCAGISFRHLRGRDVAAPEVYLHIEPDNIFAASGMWSPPSASLTQIRDAIVDQPERWKRLRQTLDEYDDGLQRTPRGYDPEHPFVEDLKRKNFTQSTDFTAEEACAPGFLAQGIGARLPGTISAAASGSPSSADQLIPGTVSPSVSSNTVPPGMKNPSENTFSNSAVRTRLPRRIPVTSATNSSMTPVSGCLRKNLRSSATFGFLDLADMLVRSFIHVAP